MNNSPAFPTGTGVTPYNPGMTLRDYFAAKAMQTYMADQELTDIYNHLGRDAKQEISVAAYMMADAMLKVREA